MLNIYNVCISCKWNANGRNCNEALHCRGEVECVINYNCMSRIDRLW